MIFQAMFAVITPALIIGAFAERMKFSAYLIFIALWSLLIYNPICHWVWGVGGFLRNMGTLDFAGGIVVHINAGIASLVAAIVLGKRKGHEHTAPRPPHNLPLTVLGAGLLWFGWFGFNAGSALGANGIAVNAFVVTNTAAAAGGIAWAILEWLANGQPTMLGTVTGAIAGLAAITPAAGFVSVMPSLIIGLLASVFCFIAVAVIKPKFGYDDSLDAFGVHGISGIWGVIAVGLFASKAVNPLGADGLFFGNPHQLYVQAIAALIAVGYAFAGSFIIMKLVGIFTDMRVTDDEEAIGLDLSQHQEGAYTILE
jgi:Amt family ammonium transporter